MTVDIDTSDLEAAFEDLSKEQARELAGRWFSNSSELLLEEGDDREYETSPVAQSGLPPQWDDTRGGWVFAFPHVAARFFNDGTETHTIEPTNADWLAFEWPDAPPEIQDQFESTFPTVFFKEVEVEGLPALRYMERGRDQAIDEMGLE